MLIINIVIRIVITIIVEVDGIIMFLIPLLLLPTSPSSLPLLAPASSVLLLLHPFLAASPPRLSVGVS